MKLRTTISSDGTLRKKLAEIGIDGTAEVRKAITESAQDVQSDARWLINYGPRSGLIYRRGNVVHRASAPGEPPKKDEGTLISHIDAEVDADGLGASVGTNLDYGAHLEFGTRKMAARPWLMPSFEKNKKAITKRVGDAVKAVLRKARVG